MSDESSTPPEGATAAPEGQSGQILLERLYLKDASFESPRSPTVFGETWRPEFQLDVNTRASNLGDDRFEVLLSVTLRCRTESRTAYIAEIQQAGVFQVTGVEAGARQRVLGTLCPSTLFPYVRETADNLVVKGGFPAVHLAPVNFDALYAEALRRQAVEAGGGDTPAH